MDVKRSEGGCETIFCQQTFQTSIKKKKEGEKGNKDKEV